MTGPIRLKGVGPISVPDSPASSAADGPSFRETLEAARTSAASAVKDVGLADLQRQLAAGTLSRTQAVESLVTRALSQANALTPDARTALEQHLRSSIESDPTLQKLFGKISE